MKSLSRGFSLIELLVVIAIVAVLFTIGYRGLVAYLETQRLREAAEKVKSVLFEARNRASLESQGYRLKICGNNQIAFVREGAGDPCAATGLQLPYGIQLEMKDGLCQNPKPMLQFTGRGLPVEARCFTLSYRSRSRKVAILATGKVVMP